MIYPNPASGLLNIDLNEDVNTASLQVFDVMGRKKLEGIFHQTYQSELDVSSLEKGIYFIEIRSEKGNLIRKFVKG